MNSRRPAALMIAPAMPARTGNGLAMRLGMFLEALASVTDVDLAVVPVAGWFEQPPILPRMLGVQTAVIPWQGRADTQFMLLSQIRDPDQRLEAFRRYARPSVAACLSAPVVADLGRLTTAKRYDLVHVGRGYMAEAAIAVSGDAVLALDADEDDRASFASRAVLARRQGHRAHAEWLDQEGLACDRLIERLGSRFKLISVAGPVDRQSLAARHPGLGVEIIPNAVESPARRSRHDDRDMLLFIGSFGYEPNVDGILWFAESIWPRLVARYAGTPRLVIAGPDPPSPVRRLGMRPGITVMGQVPDLAALYQRASLALAPLRAGGGTRIKLIEAAAHNVATVATRTAAAGLISALPPRGWTADGASEFAAACAEALRNPCERRLRAKLAAAIIARDHDRRRIVRQLACMFRELSGKRCNLYPLPLKLSMTGRE